MEYFLANPNQQNAMFPGFHVAYKFTHKFKSVLVWFISFTASKPQMGYLMLKSGFWGK